MSKSQKNNYPIIVKKPKKLLEDASPSCPICGKLFKTENDVKKHLKEIKKIDLTHKEFFESNFWFDNFLEENNQNLSTKLKFGRINIKKRNL